MLGRGHRTGSRKEHPEAPVEAEGQVRGEAERQGGPCLPEVETWAGEAEHSWVVQREPLRAEWSGRRSSPDRWLQRQKTTSAGEGDTLADICLHWQIDSLPWCYLGSH